MNSTNEWTFQSSGNLAAWTNWDSGQPDNNGGNLEKTPAFADVPYFMQKDKSGWLMAQLQDLETCDPPQAA